MAAHHADLSALRGNYLSREDLLTQLASADLNVHTACRNKIMQTIQQAKRGLRLNICSPLLGHRINVLLRLLGGNVVVLAHTRIATDEFAFPCVPATWELIQPEVKLRFWQLPLALDT